jgi:DNA polymerase
MSLDLDERQRAMLEEMHIKVWWPVDAAAIEDAPSPVRKAAAAPARPSARPSIVALRQEVPVDPVAARVTARPSLVDTMDWPTLADTVAACSACKLCVGRKAPVFEAAPEPRQADWLVVGEPPDEHEERAGKAFVGEAGQLLDNMLRAVQLTRVGVGAAGARVTSVVKCRPAAVRNPQLGELATCATYLRREIALVQPRVILAMGRFAALSLLADSDPELARLPLGKLRGTVHRYRGVPVVVTHHPSRLLRAPEDKAGAWADLCLAQSVARPATPTTTEPTP